MPYSLTTNCATELNNREKEWFDLLYEPSIWCNKYDLYKLIDYMSEHSININILKIQTCTDGSFVCAIDEKTKQYYWRVLNDKRRD